MNWRWGLAVPVGFALMFAGCGATHTITDTVTRTVTLTRTATATSTVTVVRHTEAPAARRPATPEALTDSGNGTQQIALTVAVPSTIEWTNTGSYFDMSGLSQGDTSDVAISSSASSGVSAVSPGTYPSITISTDGDWTLKIVADSP